MDNKAPAKPTSIFKKYLLYVLIGGLTITALIAIIAIIIGEWNDAISKAIGLTVSSWIHCLIALAITSVLPNDDRKRSDHWNIFTYTIFGVTIASFVTTVLNIFEIIPAYTGAQPAVNPMFTVGLVQTPTYITERLYFWYFGLILASLITTAVLNYSIKKDKNTQISAYVGVASIILFMTLFFPPVFSAYISFPDVYYRVILAVAIVFSTTIILSIVFGHLYRVKHPELAPKPAASTAANVNYAGGSAPARKGLPAWAIVLIVVGSVFIGLPVLFGILIGLLSVSIF